MNRENIEKGLEFRRKFIIEDMARDHSYFDEHKWNTMLEAIFSETNILLEIINDISNNDEVTREQFFLLKLYLEVFLNSRGMNISIIDNNSIDNNEKVD